MQMKPTSIKNPQANSVLECIHQVVSNMLHSELMDDKEQWDAHDPFREILLGITWAICSSYYTMLGATPGQIIYGWDMVFNVPFIYDMEQTHLHKQKQINQNTIQKNRKCQEYNYSVGDKVLIVKDGKLQKVETLREGLHEIIQIFANGTVTIQLDELCITVCCWVGKWGGGISSTF